MNVRLIYLFMAVGSCILAEATDLKKDLLKEFIKCSDIMERCNNWNTPIENRAHHCYAYLKGEIIYEPLFDMEKDDPDEEEKPLDSGVREIKIKPTSCWKFFVPYIPIMADLV
uniref:Saposin B-type domain-containing protein n=1 Tax=Rhabditophanes sp. KR3021 TaxID=114890 RepID=A0AC35UAP4_9BILA